MLSRSRPPRSTSSPPNPSMRSCSRVPVIASFPSVPRIGARPGCTTTSLRDVPVSPSSRPPRAQYSPTSDTSAAPELAIRIRLASEFHAASRGPLPVGSRSIVPRRRSSSAPDAPPFCASTSSFVPPSVSASPPPEPGGSFVAFCAPCAGRRRNARSSPPAATSASPSASIATSTAPSPSTWRSSFFAGRATIATRPLVSTTAALRPSAEIAIRVPSPSRAIDDVSASVTGSRNARRRPWTAHSAVPPATARRP